MKKLGIIGGMGPAATARLFSRVVDFTCAEKDQDHLDITIFNRPSIPDRTSYLLGKEDAKPFAPVLQDAARELESAGCEVIAMPCNTAHAAFAEVACVPKRAYMINMPKDCASFVRAIGCKCAGILATDGTLFARVFQEALDECEIDAKVPDKHAQARVMELIYVYVKAGKTPPQKLVKEVLDSLLDKGCDAIILGCTELSLLGLDVYYRGVAIVDALDVCAWRCVCECGAKAKNLREMYK